MVSTLQGSKPNTGPVAVISKDRSQPFVLFQATSLQGVKNHGAVDHTFFHQEPIQIVCFVSRAMEKGLDHSFRNRQRAGRKTLEAMKQKDLDKKLAQIAAANAAKLKEEPCSSATSEAAESEFEAAPQEKHDDKQEAVESEAGAIHGCKLAAETEEKENVSMATVPEPDQRDSAASSSGAGALGPPPAPQPKRRRGRRAGRNVDFYNMAYAFRNVLANRW